MKNIKFMLTVALILGWAFNTKAQHNTNQVYDPISFTESQHNNGRLYIKWYSVGSNPASMFKPFRYEGSKAVPVDAVKAVYKVKDTAFYAISLQKAPEVTDEKPGQYFIITTDTTGKPGISSSVVLIVPTGGRYFTGIKAEKQSGGNGTSIKWGFSNIRSIRYFELLRSTNEKDFEVIASLPAVDSVFNDVTVIPDKVYYYLLRAVTAEGNKPITSSRFYGVGYNQAPPVAPFIKAVYSVVNGAVLHVKVADPEAAGIRIYRNDGDSSQLYAASTLLKIPDSMVVVYYDTASHLSGRKTYTYAAKAESSSFIESGYSNHIIIRPENNRPPQSPVSLTVYEDEGRVQLFWTVPYEDLSYISGYTIERAEGKAEYINLTGKDSFHAVNHYTDSTVKPGQVYTYKIRSVGFDRLVSREATVASVSVSSDILPVTPAALTGYSTDEGVYLQWSNTIYKGIAGIKVYRYTGTAKPLLVTQLPADAAEYLDNTATSGEVHYYVTSINTQGIESPHSDEIMVRL